SLPHLYPFYYYSIPISPLPYTIPYPISFVSHYTLTAPYHPIHNTKVSTIRFMLCRCCFTYSIAAQNSVYFTLLLHIPHYPLSSSPVYSSSTLTLTLAPMCLSACAHSTPCASTSQHLLQLYTLS